MKTISVLTITILTALLVSCGGNSYEGEPEPEPDSDPTPPVGGIGRTGRAFGPISAFGSVVVNSIRYDTTSASVAVDDQPAILSDLRLGQVIVVSGEVDDNHSTGTADAIHFEENVKGTVQSIDTAFGMLVVLGQTVSVLSDTLFDDTIQPRSLDGLSVGDLVGVSGQTMADGGIAATRIEKKPAGTAFEVHGMVSNLDSANFRFSINSLVIDYSAAAVNGFPDGEVSDGDYVEANGNALGNNGALTASQVEFEGLPIFGEVGLYVEVEGYITLFISAGDFDVGGVSVVTNASTVFEGGVAADIGVNAKVEVEGTLNADGAIVAEKIDIKRPTSALVTALVDSVDVAGNSLVMLGITVYIDALTQLVDKSSADIEPLTIADLNVGDYLEIRGPEPTPLTRQVVAAVLERNDVDSRTILRGPTETARGARFTVLGVTVNTNSATVFRNRADEIITIQQFSIHLAMLTPGVRVKATGTETAERSMLATEVELE
jgi:Domain of unknown function (DUF5666)